MGNKYSRIIDLYTDDDLERGVLSRTMSHRSVQQPKEPLGNKERASSPSTKFNRAWLGRKHQVLEDPERGLPSSIQSDPFSVQQPSNGVGNPKLVPVSGTLPNGTHAFVGSDVPRLPNHLDPGIEQSCVASNKTTADRCNELKLWGRERLQRMCEFENTSQIKRFEARLSYLYYERDQIRAAGSKEQSLSETANGRIASGSAFSAPRIEKAALAATAPTKNCLSGTSNIDNLNPQRATSPLNLGPPNQSELATSTGHSCETCKGGFRRDNHITAWIHQVWLRGDLQGTEDWLTIRKTCGSGMLIALYLLGEKLNDTKLRDSVMDAIVDYWRSKSDVPICLLRFVQEEMPKSCQLRRFFDDLFLWQVARAIREGNREAWMDQFLGQKPHLTKELLLEMVGTLSGGFEEKTYARIIEGNPPFAKPSCEYHEHVESKDCYSKIGNKRAAEMVRSPSVPGQ